MALSARAPLNLPPLGFTNWRDQEGVPQHPLGTENSGRDMLALWIVGTPRPYSWVWSRPQLGWSLG